MTIRPYGGIVFFNLVSKIVEKGETYFVEIGDPFFFLCCYTRENLGLGQGEL